MTTYTVRRYWVGEWEEDWDRLPAHINHVWDIKGNSWHRIIEDRCEYWIGCGVPDPAAFSWYDLLTDGEFSPIDDEPPTPGQTCIHCYGLDTP